MVSSVNETHTTPVEETPVEEPTAAPDKANELPVSSSLADMLTQLESELEAARSKAQEYFDGWQRERADFINYKKRVERDLRDANQNAAVDTLKLLLPILDDFERALASVPEDLRQQPWLEGVLAIHRKLQKTLEDQGITAVDPCGQAFDPALHEAVATDSDTDTPSGHVTETLQKGYLYGDRVLRPALVRVAK